MKNDVVVDFQGNNAPLGTNDKILINNSMKIIILNIQQEKICFIELDSLKDFKRKKREIIVRGIMDMYYLDVNDSLLLKHTDGEHVKFSIVENWADCNEKNFVLDLDNNNNEHCKVTRICPDEGYPPLKHDCIVHVVNGCITIHSDIFVHVWYCQNYLYTLIASTGEDILLRIFKNTIACFYRSPDSVNCYFFIFELVNDPGQSRPCAKFTLNNNEIYGYNNAFGSFDLFIPPKGKYLEEMFKIPLCNQIFGSIHFLNEKSILLCNGKRAFIFYFFNDNYRFYDMNMDVDDKNLMNDSGKFVCCCFNNDYIIFAYENISNIYANPLKTINEEFIGIRLFLRHLRISIGGCFCDQTHFYTFGTDNAFIIVFKFLDPNQYSPNDDIYSYQAYFAVNPTPENAEAVVKRVESDEDTKISKKACASFFVKTFEQDNYRKSIIEKIKGCSSYFCSVFFASVRLKSSDFSNELLEIILKLKDNIIADKLIELNYFDFEEKKTKDFDQYNALRNLLNGDFENAKISFDFDSDEQKLKYLTNDNLRKISRYLKPQTLIKINHPELNNCIWSECEYLAAYYYFYKDYQKSIDYFISGDPSSYSLNDWPSKPLLCSWNSDVVGQFISGCIVLSDKELTPLEQYKEVFTITYYGINKEFGKALSLLSKDYFGAFIDYFVTTIDDWIILYDQSNSKEIEEVAKTRIINDYKEKDFSNCSKKLTDLIDNIKSMENELALSFIHPDEVISQEY